MNSAVYLASALAAAVVAGLFGLLSLVIVKENKVSDFRQAWIDALRKEIVEYAAAMKLVRHLAMRLQNGELSDSLYARLMREPYDRAISSQMAIRLRINPQDPNERLASSNKDLLARLASVRDAWDKGDLTEMNNLLNTLHDVAAPLLKEEWVRVKSGEPTYVRVRHVLEFAVVVVSSLALAILAYAISRLA